MKRLRLLSFCFGILLGFPIHAQLKVDTFQTTDFLVRKVLLGSGVDVQNIRYTGAHGALGYFKSDSTKLPFEKGIILTTGQVYDAPGPNVSPGTSGQNGTKGSKYLDNIASGLTKDCAALEFDFIPKQDYLSFNFVFASEEYPEFVGTNFNDVFGFFVSGPGIEGEKNMAVFGPDKTTVTVNNINHKRNSELFIDNNLWGYNNVRIPGAIDSLKTPEAPYLIGYDGFTTVLLAESNLVAGAKYHIRIMIADVGDFAYDSAVLLEANSFKTTRGDGTTDVVTDLPVPDVKIELPEGQPLQTVYFDVAKHALDAEATQTLTDMLPALKKVQNITLVGHTDSDAGNSYNEQLSKRRAAATKTFLVKNGIAASSIKILYLGETAPNTTNDTDAGKAKNRRVEVFAPRN